MPKTIMTMLLIMAAFCVQSQTVCKDTIYKVKYHTSYYEKDTTTTIGKKACGFDTTWITKCGYWCKMGYAPARVKVDKISTKYCPDTTYAIDSFLVTVDITVDSAGVICHEVPQTVKYGLWGNGDNVSERKMSQYNSSINGFNIRMDAATFNPAKGVWNTKYVTDQLDICRKYGLKVTLMMFTGDNMPQYMFQDGADRMAKDGVFAPVKTDRGTYPYYADPDYDIYLKMIWDKWYEVTKPYNDIIIARNPTMGSTGDVGNDGGYKGYPLDVQYNILPIWWDSFTKSSWLYFDTHYDVKTLINVGNAGEYLDWGVLNLRNMVAIKQGSFTHDLNNDMAQVQRIAKYPNLFVRGEMEGGTFTNQLVTAIVFQSAFAGVDIINVAPDKLTFGGLKFADTYMGTDSSFFYPHSGGSIGVYNRGITLNGGNYWTNDNVSASEIFGMHYWSGQGTLQTNTRKIRVWYLDDVGTITIGNKTISGTNTKKQIYADFDAASTINSSMHIYLIEGK